MSRRNIGATEIHACGGGNGLHVWITYAVLRGMASNVETAKMIDHGGALAGPISIFDLAEHQQIEADVQLTGPGRFAIKLRGRSPLDS
jgi:hypothetical protein